MLLLYQRKTILYVHCTIYSKVHKYLVMNQVIDVILITLFGCLPPF